ncbi:hypothetical protein [Lacticaseibacillus daqingensis]|uniref:hypothetical protein n=1 Tax=Lacticaseibacillus daqingensis TaxID=2486014 RepID=UPI000F796070|nr:hypothetical protein [Lacticaseibacillus daqingensis]
MNEVTLQREMETRSRLLTKTNAEFFGQIQVYLNLRTPFKDKLQLAQNLLALMNDLIDAQQDGVTAADYFGTDPKAVAREMAQALPWNFKAMRYAATVGLVGYLILMLLPGLMVPDEPVDLGQILIGLAMLGGFMVAFSWGLSSLSFKRRPWVRMVLVMLLCGGLCYGVVTAYLWVHTPLKVTLTGPLSIALIVLFGLIAVLQFNHDRKKFRFLPIALTFLFVELSVCVLALAMRVPAAAAWLKQGDRIAWFLVACLVPLYIIPFGWMFVMMVRGFRANHRRPD